MDICLFQPEIPQNAGNVARTCAVTGNRLVLVRPLGFSTASRHLKRAGLDYWEELDVTIIDDLEAHLENEKRPFYFFSSKGTALYTEIKFTSEDILIFGSETKGLPPSLWKRYPDRFYTLPMIDGKRCLNLSNAAAIVTYEGWRQMNFRPPN